MTGKGRFVCGTISWGCRVFFCFQVSFLPRKARKSSRLLSGWVWLYSRRRIQTSFPLLDCLSCENFGLAHSSIFLLYTSKYIEKLDQTEPAPFLINCQFSEYTNNSKNEQTDLGTYRSPRVVRVIPRRACSISSLYGAKTNNFRKQKKKLIFAPRSGAF